MLSTTWPLVLMYHGIVPRQAGRGNLDLGVVYADQFDRQLAFLKRRFHLLHPEELADLIERGRPLPRRSAVVSIDDGFQNALLYALPVARGHGVVPLAFVNSGHLSGRGWLWFSRVCASRLMGGADLRPLFGRLSRMPLGDIGPEVDAAGAPTREQGSELCRMVFDGADEGLLARHARDGSLVIGGHTVRHPNLSRETRATRRQEIGDDKRALEAIAGRPVRLFAYPSGDVDEAVARDVREAGYVAAFSILPPGEGFPSELERWHVPRVGIYSAGWLPFRLKCAGIDRWRHRLGLLR